MHFRRYFLLFVGTSSAIAGLGLVLSLPSSFTVVVDATTTPQMVEEAAEETPLPEISESEVAAASPTPSVPDPTPTPEPTPAPETTERETDEEAVTPAKKLTSGVFTVPFYSQLTDITAPSWKKVGCGITSLAMLIEYYYPNKIESVDTLLSEGIAAGAYDDAVGWSYSGLIGVAKKYGLSGSTHDYKGSTMEIAFAALLRDLDEGPIMASVHYTFQPTNPIPHLVIVNGITNGRVYYNDPATNTGGESISVEQFKSAWKKRYVEFFTIT